MLPADLQVALLLALTAHSPAPPPLTPALAEQGLLSSVGAWDPTRSASVGSSLFPGAPSPATPPPRAQPHARAPLPLPLSPFLHPLGRRARAEKPVRRCTCQGRKTSQGCEGTLPHLLPSDMTDTFNVRQRALSQPLTVEVVGGKRPRTATRATASQPETRRPGT